VVGVSLYGQLVTSGAHDEMVMVLVVKMVETDGVEVSVTGHTVVETEMVEVTVVGVSLYGQLVTVAAHSEMVLVVVV